MKALVVLFVLVTLSLGISSKLSHAKKLEELRSTKFGKTILNLIHLHSQVQGPIEELLDAVEELVADINTNIDEVEFKFQQRTNEHNSYVATIDQQLQDADQDIARMIDVIDNLLVPRRDQIHNKVTSLIQYDEFNRKNVEEVQVVRETEHEQFLQQIAEDNDALDAVDDAVQLVSSLTNPSLLQIKNIKFTLKRLSTKQWNRVHQGPMVQALLQIALNQNFSDQGILKQIVDALNEFRNQVVDAMNDLTKQEQINQEEYEERLDQLEIEHREFQKQITQAQLDLDATNQKINDCSQFLVQRQADRMQYQSQLNLENETYAVDSEIYNQTIGELQRELPIAEQGLQLIKSADFSDINIQNL